MPDMDVTRVALIIPDFITMQKVQGQIFLLINTWDMNVLPAAREQLADLRALLVSVERAFEESLVGGIVLLEDRTFPPLAQGATTDDRLANVIARLNQQHSLLARQNLRLELFSLSALKEQVATLESRATLLGNQVAEFERRLMHLRQQRADIVQAIELFEKPSIASALKGLIPTEADIERIFGVISDPKIDTELLKAVTHRLTGHIDMLEGAKTFADLSKARSRLDVKIGETVGDQAQVQLLLQATQKEMKAIHALSGLEPLKDEWLQELRKVEREWQTQAGRLSAMMGHEAATIALSDLYAYLVAVQVAYDRSYSL